jgi:pyrimidine dimer DNA glycosylase
MRIWSLHPKYLDAKGLVALWRETLLAKKVLQNKTRRYRNHPQLIRFRKAKNPSAAINRYLYHVYEEAVNRNYSFNKNKIGKIAFALKLPVTRGQIEYEFAHLKKKLKLRDRKKFNEVLQVKKILLHPLFKIKKGKTEEWEIVKTAGKK